MEFIKGKVFFFRSSCEIVCQNKRWPNSYVQKVEDWALESLKDESYEDAEKPSAFYHWENFKASFLKNSFFLCIGRLEGERKWKKSCRLFTLWTETHVAEIFLFGFFPALKLDSKWRTNVKLSQLVDDFRFFLSLDLGGCGNGVTSEQKINKPKRIFWSENRIQWHDVIPYFGP